MDGGKGDGGLWEGSWDLGGVWDGFGYMGGFYGVWWDMRIFSRDGEIFEVFHEWKVLVLGLRMFFFGNVKISSLRVI